MFTQNFVACKVVSSLPPPPHTSTLYEYLFAGNGVFIRAFREGLSATIPVNLYPSPLRFLPSLSPQVTLDSQPIPKSILLALWRQSCLAQSSQGLMEILFHLHYKAPYWHLVTPKQSQSPSHCQPLQAYLQSAVAEIHSHGTESAYFSATDNLEENGFRLYGVIGRLNSPRPEILLRIGIYHHFLILPASSLFTLPNFFVDVAQRDGLAYHFYTFEQPIQFNSTQP